MDGKNEVPSGTLELLMDDVKTLKKIVIEGNGHKSLLQYVTLLMAGQEDMRKNLSILTKNVSEISDAQKKTTTLLKYDKDSREKREKKVMWAVSVLGSLVAGLVGYILFK